MIGIGVIGAGGNGAGHARYYRQSPRSRLVAIADPDLKRAEAVAAECGARACADYVDFLPDVDAVVISSPNHLHRDHAVACAEAGRHIYCEKPMGLNAGQAAEIARAVQGAGVRCVVGFSVRFSDTLQTMQRYLSEGRVGRLVSLWTRRLFHMKAGGPASWRSDHALSGGVLLEINSHELDWMMAFGGEVRSVHARTYAEDQRGPMANDHVWVTMSFADGAVATLEGSQISAVPQFDRGIMGLGGAIETRRWGQDLYFARRGSEAVQVEPDGAFDLRAHFLDCIEQGVPCVADADWGLKVMTVADAIFESAASGKVQAL
jgi:predicted dehydrogenase